MECVGDLTNFFSPESVHMQVGGHSQRTRGPHPDSRGTGAAWEPSAWGKGRPLLCLPSAPASELTSLQLAGLQLGSLPPTGRLDTEGRGTGTAPGLGPAATPPSCVLDVLL